MSSAAIERSRFSRDTSPSVRRSIIADGSRPSSLACSIAVRNFTPGGCGGVLFIGGRGGMVSSGRSGGGLVSRENDDNTEDRPRRNYLAGSGKTGTPEVASRIDHEPREPRNEPAPISGVAPLRARP